MARLIYENALGDRQEILVEAEPLTIGRGPEADVDVEDIEVSRHHCSLLLWEDDWIVKDAHSRNGTLVNEKRVEIAVLKDGDIVHIGKSDLDFHTEKRQRGKELFAVLKVLTPAEDVEGESDEEDEEIESKE